GAVHGNVNDFGAAVFHEEWRFFDHVVTDIDDEVGGFDSFVDKVIGGQGSAAHKLFVGFIHHTFAKLCRNKGDAGFRDKLGQHPAGGRAVGTSANDKNRRFGFLDFARSSAHRLGFGNRTAGQKIGRAHV